MKNLTTLILLTLVLLIVIASPVLADLPPGPGGGPTGVPVGGGSPIGGGLLILAFSGLIYGFRKLMLNRSTK